MDSAIFQDLQGSWMPTPLLSLTEQGAYSALASLVARLEDRGARDAGVIPWGSPVPAFGDFPRAAVATVGLNPSNREFVDSQGGELTAGQRRFHTLGSLDIRSWSEANESHLRRILAACRTYFAGNPYDRWFRRLDKILHGTGASFYNTHQPACHLDIIPYATAEKWTDLTSQQRSSLGVLSYDTLGLLLRNSPVRVLILNGQSVVAHFQEVSGVALEEYVMPGWSLPRRSGRDVCGVAYRGVVETIAGHQLRREVLVLGYNHNIQSSFGVTTTVIDRIGGWIADNANSGQA